MSPTCAGARPPVDGTLDEAGGATRARSLILRSAAAFAVLALAVPPLSAQTVPTGYQEYFVIGRETHIWDMMDKVQNGEGGAQFAGAMNSVVTATASADNQVFYYDHWEDGLEADILNPVQGSTLVIGDGNPANGDACDLNTSPCGVDVLAQGDFVNFASDQGVAAGCTLPSAQPLIYTELCSSVPVNPSRCAVAGACTNAEVHFDGGDYIYTSGGPASIVHSQYPLTQFIGGSTEMLSRQAVEAARSYSVPVGEDLYPAFGCPNCVMEPFHYVDLNLVAFEDNTQVAVTSPGAGTVTFTLNRGQHWSSLGFIDDATAAPSLTINAGTKVSTTAPINGMIFTGGDGTWATRHYALLPDLLHSTDYVITAPGDNPTGGPTGGGTPQNRPANIYILNPDPLNALTVTTTDSVGSCSIDIPPNSVVDYFTGTTVAAGAGRCTAGGGRFVPNGSTVRLTSNRNFWGISAYDYNTNISDWGHSWLATKFLTRNYTISYAPGSVPPPTADLNPIYVAATQNNTRVQFDLDNDGVFDQVDLTGNGLPDPAPLPNNTYVVSALGAIRAFDPNDSDNTGTRIVTNKPVAVAWGQDTDLTQYSDAALDTGYTAYPTNQLFLDPVLIIDKEVDQTTVPTAGGVATYTLTVTSYDFGPLTNLRVFDLLDPAVPGAFVRARLHPRHLPEPRSGHHQPDNHPRHPRSAGVDTLAQHPRDEPDPDDPLQRQHPTRSRGHAPAAHQRRPRRGAVGGEHLLALRHRRPRPDRHHPHEIGRRRQPGGRRRPDLHPQRRQRGRGGGDRGHHLRRDPCQHDVRGREHHRRRPFHRPPGAYDPAQNAVVWTAANFPVGGPWALTFQVRVNPGVPAGTPIENRGGYESSQTPYFLSNEVTPVVVGPLLEASKTGPSGPAPPRPDRHLRDPGREPRRGAGHRGADRGPVPQQRHLRAGVDGVAAQHRVLHPGDGRRPRRRGDALRRPGRAAS